MDRVFDGIILDEAIKKASSEEDANKADFVNTLIERGLAHGYKLTFEDIERIIDSSPLIKSLDETPS